MFSAAARPVLRGSSARALQRQLRARRSLFTTPPAHRSRTWRSSAGRWGLVAAGIWYYNTHDFWSDTGLADNSILETADDPATDELATIESLTAARKQRLATIPATPNLDAPSLSTASPEASQAAAAASLSSAYPPSSPSSSASSTNAQPTPPSSTSAAPSGTEELEEEAESEGAFNPETGEINFDCPCLGGMAHGPCGPEFREAFSCFVYSQDEPKGINCIDKFKNMQDCFRLHPDVYGSELTDGEDEDIPDGLEDPGAAPAQARSGTEPSLVEQASKSQQPASASRSEAKPPAAPYSGAPTPSANAPGANLTSTPAASPSGLSGSTGISASAKSKDEAQTRAKDDERKRSKQATAQVKQVGAQDESSEIVPKAWHDTTEKNEGK